MARSVTEWIGATDDQVPPPRVRIRVYDRFEGKCHRCGRFIRPGEYWVCEHLVALINKGENRERNLGCTCRNCVPLKNADDLTEKSAIADKRKKHLLPKEPGRGWQKIPPGFKRNYRTGRMEKVT